MSNHNSIDQLVVRLEERNASMNQRIDGMATEIKNLKESVDSLVALANKSKGAFWMAMLMTGAISSIVTLMFTYWRK